MSVSVLCFQLFLAAVHQVAAQQAPSPATASPAPTTDYDFTGRFRMTSARTYDELLKTLGVSYFKRLAASKASPEFTISKNEGDGAGYTVRIHNPFARSSFSFRNGTEFTGIRPDGKSAKSVINIEGSKWTQKLFGDPEVMIVREFMPLEVKITTTANSVTATRVFRKVA